MEFSSLRSFGRWFTDPAQASRFWLGKHCVAVAWIGLALALLMPPHGLSVDLCALKSATGIPCPGCGVTRSLSCALRGMFADSLHYHPLGLFILGLFLFTALQSILPQSTRERLVQAIQARPILANAAYLTFIVLFIAYGAARAVFHFGSMWSAVAS